MSTPAAVLDFEITKKFLEFSAYGDADSALVLFRLHGRPLGWGATSVIGGQPDAAALIRQLLEQHAWSCALPLAERALQGGTPPKTLDLNGLLQAPPHGSTTGPLVTIGVCNTSSASRLEACLDSLMRLDYAPLDIVVIDASDDRVRVERLLRERYPDVRYTNAPGAGASRRCAVVECRGDILALTDGDAIVDRRWVSTLVHVFLADPEVMTVSGLVLPHRISKPFRSTLPAGAPFCREWQRVPVDANTTEWSMSRVLERASTNVAFWRPGAPTASSYTHVFEPSAVVRSSSPSLTRPAEPRRVSLRETERSIDLADGLPAVAGVEAFDGLTLKVAWLGRPIGTAHIVHRGAPVSAMWVADAIAQQLTAEILDARLGVGERVCRALLTADLARYILTRTPLPLQPASDSQTHRTSSAA
jgi:Glycosyl transferase family 2